MFIYPSPAPAPTTDRVLAGALHPMPITKCIKFTGQSRAPFAGAGAKVGQTERAVEGAASGPSSSSRSENRVVMFPRLNLLV
ncbi:uncharacterized protein EAE97_000879 [Botrytis byssoidea]|uniref:Uncharacterized protein n=1 Tax=Botrytis byssoidea TaxID=139641 RepID=A0A9P5IVT3_9HELO|nr:uncharacterized protein EAE97_000879 [Botrytis byssoidea]KAF7953480.1 hypothetical protein EAE97_000879 [Botrytis byssoidea]